MRYPRHNKKIKNQVDDIVVVLCQVKVDNQSSHKDIKTCSYCDKPATLCILAKSQTTTTKKMQATSKRMMTMHLQCNMKHIGDHV